MWTGKENGQREFIYFPMVLLNYNLDTSTKFCIVSRLFDAEDGYIEKPWKARHCRIHGLFLGTKY